MSQDLLVNALKGKVRVDVYEVAKFLANFNEKDFIYPSLLKRKLKIEDESVYQILSILEAKGFLKMYYEKICNNCNTDYGLCEYYSQIEDGEICSICDSSLGLESIKIVYRVVNKNGTGC